MAEMKPHLALTVSDVDRAVPFYRALFDDEPAKVKPGYAKFEPADPAIVLTLIQGDRNETMGVFNHGGIKVATTDDVLDDVEQFGSSTELPQAGAACCA